MYEEEKITDFIRNVYIARFFHNYTFHKDLKNSFFLYCREYLSSFDNFELTLIFKKYFFYMAVSILILISFGFPILILISFGFPVLILISFGFPNRRKWISKILK